MDREIPSPPAGKTGWPWVEATEIRETELGTVDWPRITVVTPSYNQGQFLEATIRSILLQGYPNLEYMIIDGGSTDNSVEIIQKYDKFLAYWVSESDRGQTHAINKGFRRATGALIAWQNSDDFYSPHALFAAAKAVLEFPEKSVLHGYVNFVDEDGKFQFAQGVGDFEFEKMLPWACLFNQSTFFQRNIFEDGYFLNESRQHLMDYDFFWRLALSRYSFQYVPDLVGNQRLHAQAKGSTQGDVADREFLEIYQSLYREESLSVEVKEKVLSCMQSICLNDFWKGRLSLFRQHLREVLSLAGLQGITLELGVKYCLSFLGQDSIDNLKAVKHRWKQANG